MIQTEIARHSDREIGSEMITERYITERDINRDRETGSEMLTERYMGGGTRRAIESETERYITGKERDRDEVQYTMVC